MLKRSDLAKEFELITKQEIKNYQDSYNNVLQSVRDLQQDMKHVHESALENHSLLHAQQNQFAISIENLTKNVLESTQKLDRFINDQRLLNETLTEQIVFAGDSARANKSRQKDLYDWIQELRSYVDNLRLKSENNFKIVNQNIDELLAKFRKEISDAKIDILNAPTELELVKTQLQEKISEHKVDVSGLMRELMVYKKDSVITQKKIERLDNLIDRLKGEK